MSLLEQIQVLGEKVDYISQNTQFTLSIVVGVLGVAVAIAGIALYKLSKMWVEKGVDEGLKKLKDELRKELDTDLKDYFKENPQIKWAKGICHSTAIVRENEILIPNLDIKNGSDLKYILQVSSCANKRKRFDFNHSYNEVTNTITVKIHNYEQSDHGVDWLVIWINDEFCK